MLVYFSAHNILPQASRGLRSPPPPPVCPPAACCLLLPSRGSRQPAVSTVIFPCLSSKPGKTETSPSGVQTAQNIANEFCSPPFNTREETRNWAASSQPHIVVLGRVEAKASKIVAKFPTILPFWLFLDWAFTWLL